MNSSPRLFAAEHDPEFLWRNDRELYEFFQQLDKDGEGAEDEVMGGCARPLTRTAGRSRRGDRVVRAKKSSTEILVPNSYGHPGEGQIIDSIGCGGGV